MNSSEITTRLRNAKSAAEIDALMPEFGQRRQEINARLPLIWSYPPGSALEDPPERKQAYLSGIDAVRKLDQEEESLRIELRMIDKLEHQATARRRVLRDEEIKVSLPKAVKRLPAAIAAANDALHDLEGALSRLSSVVNEVGAYGEVESLEMPVEDSGLADLLRLRDRIWALPETYVLIVPPDPEKFPASFHMFYEYENRYGSAILHRRRHPKSGPRYVGTPVYVGGPA